MTALRFQTGGWGVGEKRHETFSASLRGMGGGGGGGNDGGGRGRVEGGRRGHNLNALIMVLFVEVSFERSLF